MKRFRRILHATDFSTASRPAFVMAVDLAAQNRADLVLVHVVTPPAVYVEDSVFSAEAYRRMETQTHRNALTRLQALAARARKAGVRASAMLLSGIPFEQIVRAGRRKHADVIVIGTHGRTGLSRLFLGSVAERVVGRAGRPVLTVPAK